jgi:nucleoside-diphosphate-sugar epimerase
MGIFATGTTGTIGKSLSQNVEALKVDLTSDLSKSDIPILKGDTLIHLAGIVGPKLVAENVQRAFDINVTGTIKLAESALANDVCKFVYISTSHIYADSSEPISETSLVDPKNIYSEQKALAESELLKLFEGNSQKLLILRVFSVLDWNCKPFTLGGLVERIVNGGSDTVLNSKDERDFLAPAQIAYAIEKFSNLNHLWGVYNICSGESRSIKSAVIKMMDEINFPIGGIVFEDNFSKIPVIVGDDTKTTNALGEKLRWQTSPYPR